MLLYGQIPLLLTIGAACTGAHHRGQPTIMTLHLALMIGMLTPLGSAVELTESCTQFDDLADCIQQQVRVSGVMNMCFDDKRVTATDEVFFFSSTWPERTTA